MKIISRALARQHLFDALIATPLSCLQSSLRGAPINDVSDWRSIVTTRLGRDIGDEGTLMETPL